MLLFVLAKPRNTCICNTSECALPKLIGKTKSFKYITVVYIAVYFIHSILFPVLLLRVNC